MDNIKANTDSLREENPGVPIPVDLVTASCSGLDPHITPAAGGISDPSRRQGARSERRRSAAL
jgi:K+-transporting ATPase ATPase C chain